MKKILIIESQLITRNFFLDCLSSKGFEAIGAENGLIGVRLAKEFSPDLVICNIEVPDLDSQSILTTLRQNPVTEITPFIFIATEETDNQLLSEHEFVSDGYDTYLTQPYQEEELLSAINVQLQKQKILQQWYISRKSRVPMRIFSPIKNSHGCPSCPENQNTEEANAVTSESIFPVTNCSLLNKIFQFIEENYHQQINLSDVAEAVGYSTTYLTNQVKRQTQKGIYGWIIERRMAQACSLLLKTDESVSWIAAEVGYPDPGHFSRLFRQKYSISPKAWRDTHGGKKAIEPIGTSRVLVTKGRLSAASSKL
ncbi:MAG: response regulator transcription factor [Cyanobacteria bacterium J06635_10]